MFEFISTFFSILAEGTNCADAEYSSANDRFNNLWLNSEVYYSYDACNNSKRDSKFLSNKLFTVAYGITGYGVTKLETFLHKNQHTQRKLLNFENWTNGEPQ
jgi:hypothetical protein